MESQPFNQEEGRPGRPRARAILLVVLPPAFLGLAYVLFVEYMLRDAGPTASGLRTLLRFGGLGLTLIALISAATCGWLLYERLMRPLRLLLRLAESRELPPPRGPFMGNRGREYRDLYRLLSVLVNQNRAGARAMEELEQLRAALSRFREEIARTGQHGIPAVVSASGPLREIGANLQAKRTHLLSFFRDLRERVGDLRAELMSLGAAAGLTAGEQNGEEIGHLPAPVAGVPAPSTPDIHAVDEDMSAGSMPNHAEIEHSVERLRRLGVVFALEATRASGARGQHAGELYRQFQVGLGDLEVLVHDLCEVKRGNGGPPSGAGSGPGAEAALAQCRERWHRLVEGLEMIERRLAEVDER